MRSSTFGTRMMYDWKEIMIWLVANNTGNDIKNWGALSTPEESWKGQTITMITINNHIYIYIKEIKKKTLSKLFEDWGASVWCHDYLSLMIMN